MDFVRKIGMTILYACKYKLLQFFGMTYMWLMKSNEDRICAYVHLHIVNTNVF